MMHDLRKAEMGETCEDIGQEVLDSIINMDEVKKNIQVCTLQEDLNSTYILISCSIQGPKLLLHQRPENSCQNNFHWNWFSAKFIQEKIDIS